MINNINLNIQSIEAFKYLSKPTIANIEKDAEILNYKLGQPVCNNNIIPNKILIILSGEARLLHGDLLNTETIAILKADAFIGLASLIGAQAQETISASTELMILAISDKLILNLYKEEETFRDWCNSTIQISEAYSLVNYLNQKSTYLNQSIREKVNIIFKHLSIEVLSNGDLLKTQKDKVYLVGSGNIEDRSMGERINISSKINTRGKLPARIFNLPNSVFNELFEDHSNNKVLNNQKNLSNLSQIKTNQEATILEMTNEQVGQYSPIKKFKLVKGKGDLRECLACLQMLASELDLPYRVDAIEKILRDSIKRGKKPSIQLIGGITSMMGLYSSKAKIDPKMASRLPCPSLIPWGQTFAIVKESNSKYVEIVSPTEGFIRLKPEEISSKFEKGFIELLLVSKSEQTPEKKFGIQWLLPAINRYRGVLLQVLLASFVVQLLGLANPLMIQVIIDKVISQRSLDTLQILGIGIVFATILGGVLSSLRTFLFSETTNRIDTRLGAEVIDHLLRLPLNYFDKRPVGELGSRIGELEKIRNFLTGQALTTILDAAFSLIYIVVMVIYSWLLTLIALGVVPIQILITIIGTPLIRRQIREIAKENATTQSHLVEVLTGIQTVKAQNVEKVSRWKWQEMYSKYISRTFEKTLTGTTLNETSKVLQQLSQLLVLWIGATLVLKGELSLGQLIAFRIISGFVTQPLLRLSTIWQNVQELRVSFERLADIVDTPQEAKESDKTKIPLPSLNGSVNFSNVSFAFSQQQPNVLKNVSLEIQAGQFVGIVGQSGSGKSTLMKLLPRLYNPNSGKIMIDGYDISKVEMYSLRRQIGIVPQEPLLFAGTVSDNIALTDPEATSDEIVKVAKIANAHDFVMELEDGYSTNVGERGSGLSGGQKQRIAIARTLLNNPKLLIMDEATSALDYQTERKVCDGLKASCGNSTVFFITHRLSTVKNADLIVMLHNGSIVEKGTHDELMNAKGRYFALYRQQESS